MVKASPIAGFSANDALNRFWNFGARGAWQVIEPTTTWKTLQTRLTKDDVEVATDLYYINVSRQ